MSINKKHRPYELPHYLKEMQEACDQHKAKVEGYEAGRAAGNLHHEISTLWSDTERKLGITDLKAGDAEAFFQAVEAAYLVSLTEYLEDNIERMETVATATTSEILARDCGTSYLSKDSLIWPAFDNKGTPYDPLNEEYYDDRQAREEQGRLRGIAAQHHAFLVQFQADFDHILSPRNLVSTTPTPRPS